jgi:hypothetical protein
MEKSAISTMSIVLVEIIAMNSFLSRKMTTENPEIHGTIFIQETGSPEENDLICP